jgi:thioredoxin reductase (NADPH)
MEENLLKEIVFNSRNSYEHKPDKNIEYDCIVIGLGVTGYAAAMYGSRLGMKVLLIGENPGGTLALTDRVENYPGFVSIRGQTLTNLLENHALDYNIDLLVDIVDSVSIDEIKKIFYVKVGENNYNGRTIIFALGSNVKKLNILGEDAFFGKGVGYCALCDATFVKDKVAVVVGGGDSALKEAILLTEYAKKVYVINNEGEIHPEHSTYEKSKILIEQEKLEIINNNEVTSIIGNEWMEKIILKNSYNGNYELNCQALFVYIGRIPQSKLAKGIGIQLNDFGEIIVNQNSETNIEGAYAAGDVTNIEWKQAIIGVAQGVTAAYRAYKKLNGLS